MDFANYWASATGAAADLGQDVNQSLRFKGAQNLKCTLGTPTNQNIWTVSLWIKNAKIGSRGDFFDSSNVNPPSNSNLFEMFFNGDGTIAVGKFSAASPSTAKFRDPTAWYHVVVTNDGTDIEVYVNNSLVHTWAGQGGATAINTASEHCIGSENFHNGDGLFTEGYMAEFNFLDGTHLTPTSFGRTNEDGVWVPENLSSLTSDQYGNNGFRLTFASDQHANASTAIGIDSAPTGGNHDGANNFTASNNFDTADVNAYQSQLTSTGSFPVSKALAFDGDTSTRCFGDANATWTFAPDPAIAFDSLRIFSVGGSTTTFNWDGNSTVANTSSGDWRSINTGGSGGSISTSKPLTIVGSSGGRPEMNALEVTVGSTATIITSSTDNDVDYKDTPNNNYAVLNKLFGRSSSLNFEHANLRVQYGSGGSHPGMVGFGMPGSSGKYYWEVTLKEQKEGGIGIVSEDFDLQSGGTSFGMDSSGAGWEWIVSEGRRDNNGETPNSHTIPNVGDTIGFLLDTTAGECTIEINGVAQTANNGAKFTNIPTDKTIYPYFRLGGASGDANLDWNFGQMPFLFQPTGYNPVETDSLPEPTIKDGSDHFQTLLGGGAGTFKYASEATDKTTEAIDFNELDQFTPTTTDVSARSFILDTLVPTSSTSFTIASGWGWSGITATIRVSSDGTANSWTTISSTQSMENSQTVTVSHSSNFRYIRIRHNSGTVNFGNITTTNQPLLGRAQSTFSTGLWWIKDRQTIQNHQFVDSVRGSSTAFTCPGDLTANYSAPTGSSVAWCWNYNSSNPTENGFSIVQHTGNSTGSNTQNVAHNLGGVPDFFINFRIGDTVNPRTCWAWHSAAPTDQQRFQLDNSTVGSTLTSHWGQPTSTNLVFGPGDITNANGFNFITYVWRAVPGYSAFGKYTANGNSNGPYVHLGFKPALVIVKTISGANGSWQMYDSTRSTHNPNTLTLVADGTPIEVTSGNDMDFLSNGFKPRDNGSINNGSGNTYLYCAWAENPFGGENAPPATAC